MISDVILLRDRICARLGGGLRTAYIGGNGARNLGDEAMYEAASRLLGGRVLAYSFLAKEGRLSRVKLSGAEFFDAACLGGGTLINEYYWEQQVALAVRSGIPIFSLGTGVGSCGFGQPDAYAGVGMWAEHLKHFMCLGVRGPLSKGRLAEAGVTRAEVIGDLAMSLTAERVEMEREKAVAFNLAGALPWAEEVVVQVLRTLLHQGWRAVPIAMHPDDNASIKRVLRDVNIDVRSIQRPRTAEAFFRSVGQCRIMLGVRLHAAILASCVGVPPIIFSYRDKCMDFAKAVNWDRWVVEGPAADAPELALELARDGLDIARDLHRECLSYKQVQRDYVRRVLEMVDGGASHRDSSRATLV